MRVSAPCFARLPRLVSTVLVATGATALVITPAHAAENPVRLSAKPIDHPGQYFDLVVKPGTSQPLKIALGNHGDLPISARTYAADVYTIINGGFGAELRGGKPSAATTWLDYPTKVLTLQPDQAFVQAFTMTVPRGTAPGEYIASIVLENNKPIKGTGTVALNQVVRQAVAVAVRVPGELRGGLAVGAASHTVTAGRSVIAVEVRNTGNRRLTPRAEMVIRDSVGTVVHRDIIDMDSFYAGTRTKVEVSGLKQLTPGQYTVDLTIGDAARGARAARSGIALTVPRIDVEAKADAEPSIGRQTINTLQDEVGQRSVWGISLLVLLVALGLLALVLTRRGFRAPRAAAGEHGEAGPPEPGWQPLPHAPQPLGPTVLPTTDVTRPEVDLRRGRKRVLNVGAITKPRRSGAALRSRPAPSRDAGADTSAQGDATEGT